MTSREFAGKGVLVTGASKGIGRAVATRLATAGARVVVHFGTDAEAAAETLAGLDGDGHTSAGADLRDPGAVARLVDEAVDHLGRLDILVNNAGVYRLAPPMEVDYEHWQAHLDEMIRTNLLGPAWATYRAARHMADHGGGRVVNVSSRGAFRGEPRAPGYGAAKAGLNALGQSLAVALAPYGVTVLTLAPGFVETAMARPHMQGAEGEAMRAQSPFGRVATVEEVAEAVAYLASDAAAWGSGAILDFNGASYLRT
jgi:NAD(P)-dependent dehydrogenase (short-subunit alcohol dehydrogenase family)